MNRLSMSFEAARKDRRTALICYLMAGVPDREGFIEMAQACLQGGADVLELGIPYSDPVADGPVIQDAGVRALEAGVTPPMVLEMLKELRQRTDRPMVLMGYYNPIFRRGEERFVREAVEAGADGLIVPDLPLHESGGLRDVCQKEGLSLIQLSTPLTPYERQKDLMQATSGFLYLVTRLGVTGGETVVGGQLGEMVQRGRSIDPAIPLAAGFGISRPEHVKAARRAGVDGVVVGSALVALTLKGESARAMREKVSELAKACREDPMQ